MDSRAVDGGDQLVGWESMDVGREAVRWRERARVGGLMQGGRGWAPSSLHPPSPFGVGRVWRMGKTHRQAAELGSLWYGCEVSLLVKLCRLPLLWLGTCTAARCVGLWGVVRGFRFAQPTAIDRHRVAMQGWLVPLAREGVGVVGPDAGASGNRRSPRCGGEARCMGRGQVTCAANGREDRNKRMLRGLSESSAPPGQHRGEDTLSTGCASPAFEAALPLCGRAALHRVATGLRRVGAERLECVVPALWLGGEVLDEPRQAMQRGEADGDCEEQRDEYASKILGRFHVGADT